jgi:hypothetical protein
MSMFPKEYNTTSSPIHELSPIETFHGYVILTDGRNNTFLPTFAPNILNKNLLQPYKNWGEGLKKIECTNHHNCTVTADLPLKPFGFL